MVTGKLYKLANLHKNKRNNLIISYNSGTYAGGAIGWLWTADWEAGQTTFKDGDIFVCLGKKETTNKEEGVHYGIMTWYEALGPDGKIHRLTPGMRSAYFRNP